MEPLQDEELPFSEVVNPHYTEVAPSMEEAELLGTATMNLVDSGIELAMILGDDGSTIAEAPSDDEVVRKIRAVIFWANQLRELMQIQVAKAGNGMQL